MTILSVDMKNCDYFLKSPNFPLSFFSLFHHIQYMGFVTKRCFKYLTQGVSDGKDIHHRHPFLLVSPRFFPCNLFILWPKKQRISEKPFFLTTDQKVVGLNPAGVTWKSRSYRDVTPFFIAMRNVSGTQAAGFPRCHLWLFIVICGQALFRAWVVWG